MQEHKHRTELISSPYRSDIRENIITVKFTNYAKNIAVLL